MKEDKNLYTLLLVAFLTLSAYFLADTVDAMIGRSLDAAPKYTEPMEREKAGIEPKRELNDYMAILERGIFGEGKGPSTGAAAPAASNYRLIGTVEGESFSGAVLEETGNIQNFYRLNDKLPDGSIIIKVMREKITIRTPDGAAVDLQVVDDTKIVNVAKPGANAPGVKKIGEGKWMVDQQEVAATTDNLSNLLTQARALPYMEQGKTVGFRISEIVPGSIYEKIGLQNGDVIQRLNSQEVDDPAKFFQLYQGLKEEKTISVDLMRGGQRQTLHYEVR